MHNYKIILQIRRSQTGMQIMAEWSNCIRNIKGKISQKDARKT